MLTLRPLPLFVVFLTGNALLFSTILLSDGYPLPHAVAAFGLLFSNILGTAGFTLLATALGRFLLRKLQVQLIAYLTIPVSFGLGMLALGLMVFLLAALQAANLTSALLVLGITGYLCRLDFKDLLQDISQFVIKVPLQSHLRGLIILWIVLLLIFEIAFIKSAANLLAADYDSFHQYLTFPMAYLQHGGLTPFLWHSYWGFPQLGEMIFLLSGILFGLSGPFFINWVFFVFLTTTLFQGLRSSERSYLHHWLTACFITSPTILLLGSGRLKIELIFFFYCLLSLLVTREILRHQSSSERMRSWSLFGLLGVLCGALLSTKYTGLFVVIGIIAGLWPFLEHHHHLPKKLLLLFGFNAIVFSPWLIKNLITYESPLYPLLGGVDTFFLRMGSASHHLFEQYAAHDIILTLSQHLQQTGWVALDNLQILAISLVAFANTVPTATPGIWVLTCLILVLGFCFQWKKIGSEKKFFIFFLTFFILLWLPFLLGATWYLFPAWFALLFIVSHTHLSRLITHRIIPSLALLSILGGFLTLSPSNLIEFIRYANGSLGLSEGFVKSGRDPALIEMSGYINTLLKNDPTDRIYGFQEPRGYFIDSSSTRFILDYYGEKFEIMTKGKTQSLRDTLKTLDVRYVLMNNRRQAECAFLSQPARNKICEALIKFYSLSEQGSWKLIRSQGTMRLYEL